MIRLPLLGRFLPFWLMAVSLSAVLAAPKPIPAQKVAAPVQINGQIFVVTEGQQSIKLALVSIGQISESEIVNVNTQWKSAIEKRRLAISQRLADVSLQLRQQTRVLDELKEERSRAGEKSIECAMTISSTSPRYQEEFAQCSARPDIKEAQERAIALQARIYGGPLEKEIAGLRSQLKQLIAEFDFASTPVVPLEAYQERITATIKSDSDGKFAFSYEPDTKMILFAKSSRRVGASDEHYRWLVRLPVVRSSDSVQIMLANDNMDVSGCADCVSHVVSLDPYPNVELLRSQLREKAL